RGSGQDAIPDTSAHAAAWLRLCPSQRRPRHTGATGLARPQEHPAHRQIQRAFAGSVSRLLERLSDGLPPRVISPNPPPLRASSPRAGFFILKPSGERPERQGEFLRCNSPVGFL